MASVNIDAQVAAAKLEVSTEGYFPAPIKGEFYQKHLISAEQLTSLGELDELFKVAAVMEDIVKGHRRVNLLAGQTAVVNFAQPSSRTFASHVSAALNLGMKVVAMQGADAMSSFAKGEGIDDALVAFYQTTGCSVLVQRHPEDNSALIAAEAADKYYSEKLSVINGGSGKAEHPTQALLDLRTIHKFLGGQWENLQDFELTCSGDPKNSRTIKSLCSLLAMVNRSLRERGVEANIKINLVAPKETRLSSTEEGRTLIDSWKSSPDGSPNLVVNEYAEFDDDLFTQTDVLYHTRVQSEWFEDQDEFDSASSSFRLTRELMDRANALREQAGKKYIGVMHPLPRINEIERAVDGLPGSLYHNSQMPEGLYVRMALIALLRVPPGELRFWMRRMELTSPLKKLKDSLLRSAGRFL